MLSFLKRLGRKARRALPEPSLWAIPSLEKQKMSVNFIWETHVGENKELPCVGDVIIKLTSCSMGMTVKSDTRHRVTDIFPTNIAGDKRRYFFVRTKDEHEAEDTFFIAQLRRLKGYPRIWIGVF